ncbi:MAG: DUF4142 domain-containing protein [Chthoniobacterales bacterium]|nr:DUF4142 domain-containing protein [Chthoniobacterales bacterium]
MNLPMKISFLFSALGLFITLGAIAANPPDSPDATPASQKSAQPPSDKGDQVVTGGDLAFMNDAAPGGLAEVELGRLAVKQGSTSAVKKFAQRMIVDHSKAGEALKELARQKRVNLPATLLPESEQTMEKLSKTSGADFDQAYVKVMVTMHEKDVAAFSAVAQNATDADVKAFAAKTLPTLKMHLEMIHAMAEQMGVKVKS